MEPHPLAHKPLDPITDDRVADFLGHRDPEPADRPGIISHSSKYQDVTPVQLLAFALDREELGSSPEPHLLGDAAGHRLLLGDGHRDALATLGAAATKHLATTTGLLASTEAVRAFAALVMRLIRALHGMTPAFADRDRYSTMSRVSRERHRSRRPVSGERGPKLPITAKTPSGFRSRDHCVFRP